MKSFSFSNLTNCLKPLKQKGYGIELVISILISLPFQGISTVHSMFGKYVDRQVTAGKDVFYRMKNNPNICWRLILWLFANKFVDIVKKKSSLAQSEGQCKCLVFDDTVLHKTGRFIENVSRVWDHVSNKFVLGFKLLLMGYWDGTSFIPADFTLHREKGKREDKPFGLKKKELKKQFKKKRDKGSHSFERAKEADMDKITCAIRMFKHAISAGMKVDYVLMDSWFTCDAFIDAVLKVKKQTIHLIGMYKVAKAKFEYNGKMLTYSQIRNILGKAKRCRKLGLFYKEATVVHKGNEMKLFFSKQGANGKWKVFVCTDTRLSFIKMIEIYQIRWSIELFFKEAKQLLGLGKSQSNDFDGQIADLTITMIQHIILSLRYRFDNYETKGKLFEQVLTETNNQRLNQRLWGLFIEILNLIETLFEGIDTDILIEKIFQNDEAFEKISIILQNPVEKRIAA